MEFTWSEEQKDVRDLSRRILTDLVTDDAVKKYEADGEPYMRAVWKALSESELLSLSLSEEAGGAGMGEMELSILLREIGRVGATLPVLGTLVLAALPLDYIGGAELHQRIPKIVGQTPSSTGAWAEIGRRDPFQPTTTLTKDGDVYRVTGVKTHVEAAEDVRAFVVNAQLDGEPALIMVAAGNGVTIEKQQATNLSTLYQVSFDQAEVPPEHVLAVGDKARDVIGWTIDRLMMAQASLMLGLADTTLRLTATHATDRVQFGQPIAMFQAVGQRVADAYIDLQGMELQVWRAAWTQAQGLDSTDVAQKAKFVAAEAGHRIGATATHIHGGIGFDRDYPLYRYFLGMKLLEFSFGGAHVQLQQIGQRFADAAQA